MTYLPGSAAHAEAVLHSLVTHEDKAVGIVTEVRFNMENGRRYAFIKPLDQTQPERRLPLDELKKWKGKYE